MRIWRFDLNRSFPILSSENGWNSSDRSVSAWLRLTFTTNYDPAGEHFCEGHSGFNLTTGFRPRNPGSVRSIWDRETFDSYEPQKGKRNVVLFKLHGSADWILAEDGTIQLGSPVYMKQERYSNALIYPAMRKVGTRDPYFTAYDYFQRCCERAGLCVVVGYSFRDYNALTRLRNAVRLNPLLELYLISPNALEIAGKELVGMKCKTHSDAV